MSSVSACHSFQILCIRLWKKRGWTHARRIPVNTFICRFIFSYRRENKFCTLRIKNNVDCYINFQLTSLAYGELCRLFLVCSCSGGLAHSLCFITDTMRTQRHPPSPHPSYPWTKPENHWIWWCEACIHQPLLYLSLFLSHKCDHVVTRRPWAVFLSFIFPRTGCR